MKRETVEALDRINRDFYIAQSDEFSATRGKPWPAWNRVVERLASSRELEHSGHSILDVGCGNGRFASLLEDAPGADWSYLGIDASPALTSHARSGGRLRRRLVVADIVNTNLPLVPRSRSFDLIVVFGVLHHIPSWERRRSLLVELAGHLQPRGLLAVSFWQFGAEARFSRRLVEWNEYNRTAPEMIEVDDLEERDHLIRWGDGEAVRYCHFVDPVEAAELTAASGLHRLETFRGDGASGSLNLYHLLQNPVVGES
jgi:SAM-dependent methyltransferase